MIKTYTNTRVFCKLIRQKLTEIEGKSILFELKNVESPADKKSASDKGKYKELPLSVTDIYLHYNGYNVELFIDVLKMYIESYCLHSWNKYVSLPEYKVSKIDKWIESTNEYGEVSTISVDKNRLTLNFASYVKDSDADVNNSAIDIYPDQWICIRFDCAKKTVTIERAAAIDVIENDTSKVLIDTSAGRKMSKITEFIEYTVPTFKQ